MSLVIATDIGGTFTDMVAFDTDSKRMIHAKSHTDPGDLTGGIIRCLQKSGVALAEATDFVHGSTVAINTAIERKGAVTALVVTRGTRDVYAIGRGNRPEAYNLFFERPEPFVPRSRIIEIDERLDASGNVVSPLDPEAVRKTLQNALGADAESIAVCLLHAYASPRHEEITAAVIGDVAPDSYRSLSHQILREYREYERMSTTVLNAYVGPRVSEYIAELEKALTAAGFDGRVSIMQSNGGVMAPATARRQPVRTMESGPVSGVIAASQLSRRLGITHAVAFDMGGTTAKAALIEDGAAVMSEGYFVGDEMSGHPVMLPVVDVIEVGAGGGSIAHLDEVGSLRIGPESAGGYPGPICYGWGGTRPTVTDASAQYQIAARLLHPQDLFDCARPVRRDDAAFRRLMGTVRVHDEEHLAARHPASYPARVTVTLRDGTTADYLSDGRSPVPRWDWDSLLAKARAVAAQASAEQCIDPLHGAVRGFSDSAEFLRAVMRK